MVVGEHVAVGADDQAGPGGAAGVERRVEVDDGRRHLARGTTGGAVARGIVGVTAAIALVAEAVVAERVVALVAEPVVARTITRAVIGAHERRRTVRRGRRGDAAD